MQQFTKPEFQKVCFKLNKNDWHGTSGESVWAKSISPIKIIFFSYN